MQRAVEYRTGVQAPAEIVWEVISDFATWKDWNPVHPRIEGEMRIGTSLRVDLVPVGEGPATLTSRSSRTGCPTSSCTGAPSG
jgi:uncharacterized protein YndB with AHSA1/START domain